MSLSRDDQSSSTERALTTVTGTLVRARERMATAFTASDGDADDDVSHLVGMGDRLTVGAPPADDHADD